MTRVVTSGRRQLKRETNVLRILPWPSLLRGILLPFNLETRAALQTNWIISRQQAACTKETWQQVPNWLTECWCLSLDGSYQLERRRDRGSLKKPLPIVFTSPHQLSLCWFGGPAAQQSRFLVKAPEMRLLYSFKRQRHQLQSCHISQTR